MNMHHSYTANIGPIEQCTQREYNTDMFMMTPGGQFCRSREQLVTTY